MADHEVGFNGKAKPKVKAKSKRKSVTRANQVQIGGRHYRDMKIQPLWFCYQNRISGPEMLAIKYISRHRTNDGVKDLLKAIHCLQLLLLWEYQLDDAGVAKAKKEQTK